jgi:phosphohistidine phosphatase SixA
MMRLYTGLIFLFVILLGCSKANKIYFVRHAEKGTAPAGDPDLTAAGIQRAEALEKLLRGNGIEAIYSTETGRTRQTAGPLSRSIGIPIRSYSNDTTQKFLYHLLANEQNSLVVGHSNTVLKMIRDLGLTPAVKEISDNEYDNLFIVTQKTKSGVGGYKLSLRERTYGKRSPSGTDGVPGTGPSMMK